MAYIRDFESIQWINAGAIGMPAHNGSQQTEYVIISDNGPEIHKLAYDHVAASERMQVQGLTAGYHLSLLTGWWPSEDILPKQLCRVDELETV